MTFLKFGFGDVPDAEPTAFFGGVLRGVQHVPFGKLARALTMQVVELAGAAPDAPNFLVIPTDIDADDENGRPHRRGTQWRDLYPDDAEGEYVCLYDKDIEPCHCGDQLYRGETKATPCAHVLAALVHVQHPQIMPLVAELKLRNQVAAAATGESAA